MSKLSKGRFSAKDRVLNSNVFAEYRALMQTQSSRMYSYMESSQERCDNGQQGMSDPEEDSSDESLMPGEMSSKQVAQLFDKGLSEKRLWNMQVAKYRLERMKRYSECVRTRADLAPFTAGGTSNKVIATTGMNELSVVKEVKQARKLMISAKRNCCSQLRASSQLPPSPRSGGNTSR